LASSVLAGTVVGVGIFSLPYITSRVGLLTMSAYFIALGGVSVLIHLFFGEIALKSPDFKRLPGLVKTYLGKKAEKVSFVSSILGLSGAVLAYLIVGGEFLASFLMPYLGQSQLFYTLVYFFIGSAFIFSGIKAIARVEFWAVVLFILVLTAIFFKAGQQDLISFSNLFSSFGQRDLFLPYGAVLFSLWGISVVPEMEEMLGNDKRMLKSSILAGMAVSIAVSFLFVILVLGITGLETVESALPGLEGILGKGTMSLTLLFGLAATFTSFVTLGLTLKKVFCYDLNKGEKLSWALSCFPALILFLLGIKSFIGVISFVGGVMIGLDGFLVILIYQKIKGKRCRIVTLPLAILLLFGIVYEIIYFLT